MYAAYLDCIRENLALPPAAWAFKRDPRYTAILEHVTPEQGAAYLDEIRALAGPLGPAVLDLLPSLAAQNDALGHPVLADYPEYGLRCAPSNLRYACHAIQIWRHACAHRMLEIGGGYGGLALYLHSLASVFGVPLADYAVCDLPEAEDLQWRFADATGLRFSRPDTTRPSFCISAYAFSEFDRRTRDWYAAHLLRRCPHGWMLWNGEAHPGFAGPVYPFVDAPLAVEDERPLTGPGNKVVTW